MDSYIKKALLQFQHELPTQHFYTPSKFNPSQYGAKQQFTTVDTSQPLTPNQTECLEQISSSTLYKPWMTP